MFTLFSGRHIGAPRRCTNMAFPYWSPFLEGSGNFLHPESHSKLLKDAALTGLFNSDDKASPTSLFGYDVQQEKK